HITQIQFFMKYKLLLAFAAVAFVFTACNNDEIDSLKKRIKILENATGTNEPIIAKFSTTNDVGAPVIKNTGFYFKSVNYYSSYMSDNGDGTIYVYMERFSDVDLYDYADIGFNYDPETKEVTYPYCYMEYR